MKDCCLQVGSGVEGMSGPGQLEVEVEVGETRSGQQVAVKRTISSKPIPPSLRGNTPFIEPVKNNTEEPLPLESHEALGESQVAIPLSPRPNIPPHSEAWHSPSLRGLTFSLTPRPYISPHFEP